MDAATGAGSTSSARATNGGTRRPTVPNGLERTPTPNCGGRQNLRDEPFLSERACYNGEDWTAAPRLSREQPATRRCRPQPWSSSRGSSSSPSSASSSPYRWQPPTTRPQPSGNSGRHANTHTADAAHGGATFLGLGRHTA